MAENELIPVGEPSVYAWQRDRQFGFLLHFGFVLIGVVTTLLGPILPILAAKWSLDDAELGLLFTAQFTGAMIGAALSSRMIVQLGLLRLLVCGYALTAVAVACLGVGSWWLGLLAAFSAGLALGFTTPAINLLIAQINPERPAAAVNILNFVWALGAVAGPPMIAFFGRDGHLTQALIGLAVLLACVAFWTARRAVMNFVPGQPCQVPDQSEPKHFGPSVLRGWLSPYALLTDVLIFIYVGTETATSGWIATYALRLGESTSGFEMMTPSVFWAGLLIGRATAPAILVRVNDAALVLFGLVLGSSGLVLILASSNLLTVIFGAGLTGLGLASVFPTTFAIFARHFADRASKMVGSLFVIGGLGGALIPWFVGLISERFGDLRVGILVPALGVASMIALQICIIRIVAQRHS
jgi:MFS transporter, FHS family, glucose/mannose:H+ symporter